MFEVKRGGTHRIVETEYQRDELVKQGYEIVDISVAIEPIQTKNKKDVTPLTEGTPATPVA